ncbi:MAG TPA: S41 family peptidase [Thermoanaerobaculia bacterium]|nr:S41 family peptidase [Thermoanaerobaculia bacterium]
MIKKLLPLLLLLALPVQAAPAAQNRQAAEVAAALVEEMFVFPDQAKKIADHLRSRAAAGAFDAVPYGPELAKALTDAMHAVEDDKHVNVRYRVEDASQPLLTVQEALERLRKMRGEGGGGAPRSAEMQKRDNYGVRAVEHLPGNVGYLRIDGFHDIGVARDTIAAALKVLENADAMIIDLRQNRGGSNTSVAYLASHFLPPDHRVLTTRRLRGESEPDHSRVVETPTRRFENVPLYILTSNETFSAGEAFAYILQQYGRATTIGETTKGGGRPNAFMPLGGGLTLSVSIASVEHPKTGRSWQGVGVIADVKTPVADALEVAQRTAREKLTGTKAAAVELPAHLASLIAAFNGTPAELEQYAAKHYAASFLASRTPEDRARMLERLRGDFGKVTATAIAASTPDRTSIRIEGTTGQQALLVVEHESAPDHAIKGLQVQLVR